MKGFRTVHADGIVMTKPCTLFSLICCQDESWSSGFSPPDAKNSRCLTEGWPCLFLVGGNLAARRASGP